MNDVSNLDETDGTTEQTATDERKRLLLLALFLLLLRQTRDKMQSLILSYLRGTSETEHVSEGLIDILTAAHTMAVSLGRQLAGQAGDNSQQNRQFAIAVMVGQTGYLSNLVHDLRAGRYPLDDGALPKLLVIRIRMYVQGLRNTAVETWVRSLPDDTLLEWVTTAHEHCRGCLRMEESNPHKASEMTEFPGDEECGPNCGCYLRIVGGASGFELPEDF